MLIVVKVGSASLVDEHTFQPKLSTFESIAETIALLRVSGHNVVLVSSGAVALGRGICGVRKARVSKATTQMLAAVGQAELMSIWGDLFAITGQPIAQVLLTKESEDKEASSVLHSLLDAGIVPIVNENDAIATIPFGGNDVVASLVAQMLDAEVLAFLTDVDCLYDKDPRAHCDAQAIEVVRSCSKLKVDASSKGSGLGTGGMNSKFISAKHAASLGITTILNNATNARNIVGVVHNLILDGIVGSDDKVANRATYSVSAGYIQMKEQWLDDNAR